jgi:hypothetical protein
MQCAHVLADALAAGAGFFVTLDQQHFLDRPDLQAALPLRSCSPGDFLAVFRSYW